MRFRGRESGSSVPPGLVDKDSHSGPGSDLPTSVSSVDTRVPESRESTFGPSTTGRRKDGVIVSVAGTRDRRLQRFRENVWILGIARTGPDRGGNSRLGTNVSVVTSVRQGCT